MPNFEIVSDFGMTGDQPQAADKLVEGLEHGFNQLSDISALYTFEDLLQNLELAIVHA